MATRVDASLGRDVGRIDSYRRRLAEILGSLDLNAVSAVVEELHDAWRRRALITIAGNGGSASTASHMATDLVKATRVDGRPAVRAMSLADNVALLTALSNDESYEVGFERQLDAIFRPGDVLVLISASGSSPNVVRAAREAKALGGKTIGLLGFDGGELASICDLVVHAETEHGEYGPVEDVHLILNHMIADALLERITSEGAK